MTRKRHNLAKEMARLNPKSMGLTGGFGGKPDITAEDVAAALGMAGGGEGPRLAVIVVALRWWPGLVEGPMRTVGYRHIKHKIPSPVPGKAMYWQEPIPIERPAETPSFLKVANVLSKRLRTRVYKFHGPESALERFKMKPETFERVQGEQFLGTWARAVIGEYRAPHHCPTCTPWGRAGEVPFNVQEGSKVVEIQWRTCPQCAGGGVLSWGSGRRAKGVGMRNATFLNHLNVHHEGALAFLRDLENRGVQEIKARL